jgi:hypothetical protein
MDFISLLYLLVLALCGWFWLNGIHVLEIARKAGRDACIKADVQFLDDTVASTKLRLGRNHAGRRVLRRTYHFEFSETGNTRREGQVIMLGDRIESVTMDPYQIVT